MLEYQEICETCHPFYDNDQYIAKTTTLEIILKILNMKHGFEHWVPYWTSVLAEEDLYRTSVKHQQKSGKKHGCPRKH